MTLLLSVIGGLILAAMAGLVAVTLLLCEDEDVVSEEWRREKGWWVR